MRTLGELREKLTPYLGYDYIYSPETGYIVWREGTGNNLEILFIEAAERGKGHGKEMCRRMVKQVKYPPYHTVFSFMLSSNSSAREFYSKLGWAVVDLGQSVYRDDGTSLVWIKWDDLLNNLKS